MQTLPTRFTLIVPDTCKIDVSDIAPDLIALAGGFTSWKIAGSWTDADGDIVHDTSTLVEVYSDDGGNRDLLAALTAWAGLMLAGGEQSVALTIDGTMFLLDETDYSVAIAANGGLLRRLTSETATALAEAAGTLKAGPVGEPTHLASGDKLWK